MTTTTTITTTIVVTTPLEVAATNTQISRDDINSGLFKVKKRLMTYAQECEDLILFALLKNISNGFYVDVGANDPWYINVTQLFYERGWRGINIEPLKARFDLLQAYRPEDINLNIGCGAEEGYFALSNADAMATMDPRYIKENQSTINVPVRKLSNIFFEHKVNKIDFLKIDVEGFEKQVLQGMDFIIRPLVFCIESAKPGTGIPCHEEWEYILTENDYEIIGQRGINRYYVDTRRKHEIGTMEDYDNLSQEYTIYQVKHKKG